MYPKNTSHTLLWKESESNEKKSWKGREGKTWKSELKTLTKRVKVVIGYTPATSSRLVVGSHMWHMHSNTPVTEVITPAFCALRNITRIECRDCAIWCVQMQLEKEGGMNSNMLQRRGKIFVWTVVIVCDFCLNLQNSRKATTSLYKSLWDDGCLNILRWSL